MRRLFLRGMTGHDEFPIMDVYARARHTGLLDVYKGKPVITRHCRPIPERPTPAARPADAYDPRLDLSRASQAHRSKPRVTRPENQSWVGGEVSGRRRKAPPDTRRGPMIPRGAIHAQETI